MAESPLIFAVEFKRSSKNAATMTTGIATARGASPNAMASASFKLDVSLTIDGVSKNVVGGHVIQGSGGQQEQPGMTAEMQAAIAAQAQRQVDEFYKQQYAGFISPYTHAPIESEADYLAYMQAFEAEERQRKFGEMGLDPNIGRLGGFRSANGTEYKVCWEPKEVKKVVNYIGGQPYYATFKAEIGPDTLRRSVVAPMYGLE